jgi:hypothetical protein
MTVNTSTLLPDVTAIFVTVAATVAATHWAGGVVDGKDLVGLYGIVLGYVFGRNVPSGA